MNHIFSWLSAKSDSKNEMVVVDPLCCLFRLGFLSVLPIGTKVTVRKNSIAYQSPGISQGPVRLFNGDARDDIHNLYKPLLMARKWLEDVCDGDYKKIIEFAISGLEKLKITYGKTSIVGHTISHYIATLRNDEASDDENNVEMKEELYEGVHKALKEMWDSREVLILSLLLELCCDIKMSSPFITAAHEILRAKEKKTALIVKKVSTRLL